MTTKQILGQANLDVKNALECLERAGLLLARFRVETAIDVTIIRHDLTQARRSAGMALAEIENTERKLP